MSLWDLVPGGDTIKKGLDAVGGKKALTDTWDKAQDSDMGKSMSMNNTFREVGNILDNDVKASDINISATEKSDMGIFLQTALNKMGHNLGTPDGKAEKDTVTALNTALDIIREENSDNIINDKLEGATYIKDISELSGPHVHAIQVGLLDRDDLSDADKQEMAVLFGKALRDIDNKELHEYADTFDPAGAKPDQSSSLEGINLGTINNDISASNDDPLLTTMKLG